MKGISSFINFSVVDKFATPLITENGARMVFHYPCKDNFTCQPYNITLQRGKYRIELWGAEGGHSREWNKKEMRLHSGGRGAYTRGDIDIETPTTFYIYLGGAGESQVEWQHATTPRSRGGWNFGGNGGVDLYDWDYPENSAGGGGGVDIRIDYYDININPILYDYNALEKSIKSRIMVAGSGGGGCSGDHQQPITYMNAFGGHGGALNAADTTNKTLGGTQIRGVLGKGHDGQDFSVHVTYKCCGGGGSTGGGGAGYRGAVDIMTESKDWYSETSAAGGSSYISGHPGCLSPDNTTGSNAALTNPYHYSGLAFTNTVMVDGGSLMPQPEGKVIGGHRGPGAAAITLLDYDAVNAYVYIHKSCVCRGQSSRGSDLIGSLILGSLM